jgi:hypothetical protein
VISNLMKENKSFFSHFYFDYTFPITFHKFTKRSQINLLKFGLDKTTSVGSASFISNIRIITGAAV